MRISYNLQTEAELSVFQWIETWYNRRKNTLIFRYKTIEGEIEWELYLIKKIARMTLNSNCPLIWL